MKYLVYVLVDPIDLQIRYVGKSSVTNLARRFDLHMRDKSTRKARWIKSLQLEGLKPSLRVVQRFKTEVEAFEAEVSLIAKFRAKSHRLYNITEGGEGASGWVWTPEQRKRLSVQRLGKKLTAKHRENISKARTGRSLSMKEKAVRYRAVEQLDSSTYIRS